MDLGASRHTAHAALSSSAITLLRCATICPRAASRSARVFSLSMMGSSSMSRVEAEVASFVEHQGGDGAGRRSLGGLELHLPLFSSSHIESTSREM